MPMGPIHETMGDKVIYDSGLSRTARVAAIINMDVWQWSVANSTELLILKDLTQDIPPPIHSRKDRVIWCPSRTGNYSTALAWDFFRKSRNKVAWHSLV